MAVSVAVYVTEGKGKILWAWSASEKNYKFGSTKTSNTTVGGLIAVHSLLQSIPSHLDIIIRSQDKEVNKIMSNLANMKTNNPVIKHIVSQIKSRQGFLRCIYVSPTNLKLEDKRARAIIATISNGGKKPQLSTKSNSSLTSGNSLLRPSSKTKTVTAKVKKPKKVEQKLTTGLEDWDDENAPRVIAPPKPKTVKCDSCNAPISPLTNECLCSV